MRRPRRAVLLGLVPLLLAACGGDTTTAGPAPAPAPSIAATLSPGVPTLPSASVSPTVGADEAPVLVLRGDGLGLFEGDVEVQALPFGTPADAVRQVLEDTLGPTTPAELPDCLGGPRSAVLVEGFTALLDLGVFVGWRDSGADAGLTTAEGLGVGSRLDELQSVLPDVQVGPGVAGVVWTSATGLVGELSDPGPDAAVTAIAGGQSCAPR